ERVVRAVAVGLAASEFAEVAHLIAVGLGDDVFLGHRQAQTAATLDEGLELAATLVGTPTSTAHSTFTLRARHTGGEAWEPAVVLVAGSECDAVDASVTSVLPVRGGVSIVVAGAVASA